MRLPILMLCAAGMLAACEPRPPDAPAPAASAPALTPPELPGIAEPGPEMALMPMDREQGDSPEARQRAEQSIRDLERSASTLPSDIAGVRRAAEEARRNARIPEPELPAPSPSPPEPPRAPAPPPPPPAPVPSPSPTPGS